MVKVNKLYVEEGDMETVNEAMETFGHQPVWVDESSGEGTWVGTDGEVYQVEETIYDESEDDE